MRILAGCAGLLGVAVLMSACSSEKSAAPAAAAAPAAPAYNAELWGDLKSMVSVKELMHDMIDPIADNIFDAVSTVNTKKGVEDRVPKTDEDWDKLRIGAVTMVEGANLLRIARPFAPPGDKPDSDSVLTTDEITAKRNADPVEWNARVEALRNVGLEVLEIIKRKDVNELWDASDNLDTACENCHRSFWYPKEDAEFYKKLNNRLKDYVNTQPAKP